MSKSDYFLLTPISKWQPNRIVQYLTNKHINLTPAEKELILSNTLNFCTLKLRTCKKIFAVNGISIYLAIRDRIEKEESTCSKLSPLLSPNQYNYSIHSPLLSPNRSNPSVKSSMSELILEPRAIDVNPKLINFEKAQLKKFIDEHPPLLWQSEHFNYFLETLSIVSYVDNVDEVIFYTADQFDKLFPTHGELIYNKLRDRFIRKDISYIKPREYITKNKNFGATREAYVNRVNGSRTEHRNYPT